MALPIFFPSSLDTYNSYEIDEELFKALIRHPKDLVLFFEYGFKDIPWVLSHKRLFEWIIRWSTKQFYLGLLKKEDAQQLVRIIQDHSSVVQPWLFFRPAFFLTLQVIVKNHTYLINTFLFGVNSPVLEKIFKRECFEKLNHQWTFSHLSSSLFVLIHDYILHGTSENLWALEQAEIFTLMKQARDWEIFPLMQECAEVLKRYLQIDTVITCFIEAHQQNFQAWKKVCQDFFNQQTWGLRLLPCDTKEIKIEFLDAHQETIELFDFFAPFVTQLAFSGSLSDQPFYHPMLNRCLHLTGLDLSGFDGKGDPLNHLPDSLIHFNLAASPWVQPDVLHQLSKNFPHTIFLDLASNSHLSYLAWGKLAQFKELEALRLAFCYQLTDENLRLITQGLPYLLSLDLEECRKISEQGLLDAGVNCMQLSTINLNFCSQLSNQTITRFITLCHSLTEIYVKGCGLTEQTIEWLNQRFPQLLIIL
jgi:F-box and leucine-rich repeat protein 2/20